MQRQGEYRESADAAGGVYEQSPYQQPYPYTEPAPSQGFGVASLVLGIVSLVLFCTCVNVLLAVIAIVFGIVQLAKPQAKKGMAIAGIITSAVSLVLFVIFVISFLLSADFQEGFQRGLRNGLGEDFYYNYCAYSTLTRKLFNRFPFWRSVFFDLLFTSRILLLMLL